MTDPYYILGVPSGAPIAQVKEAYKRLASIYGDDPDSASKMNEINEAYDRIIMSRSGENYSDFSQSAQYNGSTYAFDLNDIRSKIAEGRLDDAELLLDGIPTAQRSAEWYYLKGTIQQRRGWLDEAAKNFEAAARLEPQNQVYSSAYNAVIRSRNGGYRTSSKQRENTSRGKGCSPCNMCTGLLCADCCCESMGGDLIPCC